MLSYFLRQLRAKRGLKETIRRQQETIETLEEALRQPCPVTLGDSLLIDLGDSYRVFKYHSDVDKSSMRPHERFHWPERGV